MIDLEPYRDRLSFSTALPDMQIAWDSTSVGTFKECPRKYQLNILFGWVPREESVHLTFGLAYHSSLEAYDRAKTLGADHQQAMRFALRHALTVTWNSVLKRPWFSDHKYKNRFTLVRSVIWYLNKFKDDPLETVILRNGKPALELSWRLELGTKTPTGENLILCGHIDRLAHFQGHTWISDRKTTYHTISDDFFTRYSPDNQFSTYSYAGQIIYETPIKGIIADVAQILVEGTRFHRGFVPRTPDQLSEWRHDLDWWLAQALHCAETGYWPQNDKSCALYGGCPYRQICGKSPSVRLDWLKAGFVRRKWDPLQARGDI